jgi:AraC-like DNA-binding protein
MGLSFWYNSAMDNRFEQINLGRNILINVSEAPAPAAFPSHWHSEVEIIAPLQDHYRITINNVTHTLTARDIVLVFPGEIHAIASGGKPGAIVLQFLPTLFTQFYEFRHMWALFGRIHVLQAQTLPALTGQLMARLMEIVTIHHRAPAFREVGIYVRLLDFFLLLGQYCLENMGKDTRPDPDGTQPRKIAEACAYLVSNCAAPITLEQTARQMGYSKFYFSRLFKRCTHQSFSEFITTARLQKAEQLLAEKDADMVEIAMQAGFGSLSTFNRVFKQVKGCTPSAFRKLYVGALPDEEAQRSARIGQ